MYFSSFHLIINVLGYEYFGAKNVMDFLQQTNLAKNPLTLNLAFNTALLIAYGLCVVLISLSLNSFLGLTIPR